jgi:hypothetical protein
MKFLKYQYVTVAAILFAVGCAKRPSDSYDAAELASLKAWMVARNLMGQCDTLDNGGIYMVRTEAGTSGVEVKSNNWLLYDLTVSNIYGHVYYTRNEQTARIEGTFTRRTHYTDYYNYFSDPNYGTFNEYALWLAVKNMHEGDSAAVYATSRYTYGGNSTSSLFVGGYQGQSAYPGNIPTVFNVRLRKVIDDPTEYENGLVDDYAAGALGLTDADTVKTHHYFKLFPASTVEFARDSVREDSTVNIYYITRFLDGFVIDTNIDSVARRVWGGVSTYSPISYSSSSSSSYIEGMKAVYKMCYRDWCTTVFTSAFGYTYNGVAAADANSSTGTPVATEIRPYTPLILDLYVADFRTAEEN